MDHYNFAMKFITQISKKYKLSETWMNNHAIPNIFIRHAISTIFRYKLNLTYENIGFLLGKTHATVMNSLKKDEDLKKTNFFYCMIYSDISEDFNQMLENSKININFTQTGVGNEKCS